MQYTPQSSTAFGVVRKFRYYRDTAIFILISIVMVMSPWLLAWSRSFWDEDNTMMLLFLSPFGLLLLTAIAATLFRRQRAIKKSAQQPNKKTFIDATGVVAIFETPPDAYTGDSKALLANERVIMYHAPVISGGRVATEILGVATYTNQENLLILTENLLFAVQIPLTSGRLLYQSKLGDWLALASLDALHQNIFSSALASGDVKQVVDDVIASQSLEQISEDYYSYVLQLSSINKASQDNPSKLVVKTDQGTEHSWLSLDKELGEQFFAKVIERVNNRSDARREK